MASISGLEGKLLDKPPGTTTNGSERHIQRTKEFFSEKTEIYGQKLARADASDLGTKKVLELLGKRSWSSIRGVDSVWAAQGEKRVCYAATHAILKRLLEPKTKLSYAQ